MVGKSKPQTSSRMNARSRTRRGPAHEHLEQRELGAGQLDRPAAAHHLAGRHVQGEVGERQHLVGAGAVARMRPAEQRAQPGEQLLQRERLGEVVVGAGVEPLHPVADRVAGGEHQDRQVVARGAQRAGGLDAVEARHHHVDHEGVRGLPGDAGQRLGTVAGQRDGVAVELQGAAQRLAHRPVVVDDEDARGLGGRGGHAPSLPLLPEPDLRTGVVGAVELIRGA